MLGSIIQSSVRSLKHYIEDPQEPEITWANPFVELHYPIEWDWKSSREKGDEHGNILFGEVTAGKMSRNDLAKIMVRWINSTALAELTNWARFAKRGEEYVPYFPEEVVKELNALGSEADRRALYEEIVRPFSIGAAEVDIDVEEFEEGLCVPSEIAEQLAGATNAIDIRQVHFSGDVNGHEIDLLIVFQIHPLVTDYGDETAYHPITVGLQFRPEIHGNSVKFRTPARWSRKDRSEFWIELFQTLDELVDKLIPKEKQEESIILTVNAELKIPASQWKPETQSDTIQRLAAALAEGGDLVRFGVSSEAPGLPMHDLRCPTCGCTHDKAFTQFNIPGQVPFTISGVLPDIVRCVHAAHESGLNRLSTKDEDLLRRCGGYGHPSKAFYDLEQREAYRLLFDTSRRGFISLRGFTSRT